MKKKIVLSIIIGLVILSLCSASVVSALSTHQGGRSLPGDADGDGDVDQADLGILLSTYGLSFHDPNYDPRADFDFDGDVDQVDLGILLAHYGWGT